MSEPHQPPTDLISMAADGRLKESSTYLELMEDKLAIEQDIADMEAQLLTSGRSEEWRDSCLYNLSRARGELKSVKNGLLQIEELCRIVCATLSNKDREERRMKHELAMAEASARKEQAKAQAASKPLNSKREEEKTKRLTMTLDRDHKAAQLFKRLVKPIIGEDQYNLICIEAKRILDAESANHQSTETKNQNTETP